MAHLIILRTNFEKDYTEGVMLVDGKYFCYTLEDRVRPPGVKIPYKTAIPEGTYSVRVTPSGRFKRLMPEVLRVPGFTGIRIHGGNSANDSAGCPLVGTYRLKNGKMWLSKERHLRRICQRDGTSVLQIIQTVSSDDVNAT